MTEDNTLCDTQSAQDWEVVESTPPNPLGWYVHNKRTSKRIYVALEVEAMLVHLNLTRPSHPNTNWETTRPVGSMWWLSTTKLGCTVHTLTREDADLITDILNGKVITVS